MSATDSPPEPGRKAEYVCSACGHRSPPTGDWLVTGDRRRDYRCPDCGHLILSQPTFGEETRTGSVRAAGRRLCRVTARAAAATATAFTTPRTVFDGDRS
jgi:DNA-directed RNA polymerase subunit RPC12/RpoP